MRTATEARAALDAHKATCGFRPTAGDRRSGASICPTCWDLTQSLSAAERREGQA